MMTFGYRPDFSTAVLIVDCLILMALCLVVFILVGVQNKVDRLSRRMEHEDEMRIWRP